MPIWVAALLGGLLQVLSSIVGRVLLALGIGYVTYSGLSTLIGWTKASVISSFAGLPATAVGMLGTMKVDVCISILFSAIAVRLVMQGLASDAFKRMVVK